MDLKRNKRLLDKKSWEPLDTAVSCVDEDYVDTYVFTTVELVSWRIKNKAEDYINKLTKDLGEE